MEVFRPGHPRHGVRGPLAARCPLRIDGTLGRDSRSLASRAIRLLGRNPPARESALRMTPAGLEPAIPGSVGRCLIHWATGPSEKLPWREQEARPAPGLRCFMPARASAASARPQCSWESSREARGEGRGKRGPLPPDRRIAQEAKRAASPGGKSLRRAKQLLTAVGFEPTQLALVELESTPLDHSGKLSCWGRRPRNAPRSPTISGSRRSVAATTVGASPRHFRVAANFALRRGSPLRRFAAPNNRLLFSVLRTSLQPRPRRAAPVRCIHRSHS